MGKDDREFTIKGRRYFVTGSVSSPTGEIIHSGGTDLAELGRAGANERWKPYHDLVEKACNLAEKRWQNGDKSWHPQMTDTILSMDELKDLKRYRSAVLKRIGKIAEQFGKKRGAKTKKN